MLTEARTVTRSAHVIVLRIALVAVASGAVVAGFLLSRGGAVSRARRYVCPMHSEVSSAQPGDCPICGMALEELDATSRAAAAGEPTGSDDIALTAVRSSAEATSLLRSSVAQVRRNVNPGEVFAPAIAEADGTITARLYRDELATLGPEERAEFVPSAAPDAAVAVERSAADPVVHTTLADVAFHAARAAAAPPAGQIGWVKLAFRSRDMLVVRSSAIVQSADGPYVLVFSAQKGTLARRKIEVGKDFAGMTAVLGGLRDKEYVVMGNTFSFDAERRQQAAQ
jgi:hypothetical protein